MIRLALFLLMLLMFAPSARADDISAASRSVVRVVVIAFNEDGEVAGFGHGSGFAVGRNRIVTNAHVVAPALEIEGQAVVGVVPSEGSQSYRAEIARIDPARDLALLQMEEGALPTVSLYTGPLEDGATVAALGYPGNVDLATAQSAEDYIRPLPPTRSLGNFSNMRPINGISALLHTANIARGHSGGPLVDACGRVLGVNTFITRGDEGDSPFALAIAMQELTVFLRESGQDFSAVSAPCVSMEARLAADRDRLEQEERQREEARERQERDAQARLAQALADNQEARENQMALAMLLMVLGLVSLGGGGILYVKNRNRPAIVAAAAGTLLLIGAGMAFLTRPDRDDVQLEKAEPKQGAAAESLSDRNLCRLVPERSRITVSSQERVELGWSETGCVNARTQYAATDGVWTRILVPNEEQTVSVLQVDPGTGEYIVNRYLVSAETMSRARDLRRNVSVNSCTTDPSELADLAASLEEIRKILPRQPNERLVYECGRTGAADEGSSQGE